MTQNNFFTILEFCWCIYIYIYKERERERERAYYRFIIKFICIKCFNEYPITVVHFLLFSL